MGAAQRRAAAAASRKWSFILGCMDCFDDMRCAQCYSAFFMRGYIKAAAVCTATKRVQRVFLKTVHSHSCVFLEVLLSQADACC